MTYCAQLQGIRGSQMCVFVVFMLSLPYVVFVRFGLLTGVCLLLESFAAHQALVTHAPCMAQSMYTKFKVHACTIITHVLYLGVV